MNEQEYHLYQTEIADTTDQAHHYDQDSTWAVETHDARLTAFLRSTGATEQPCLHDGRIFVVDAKQLIQFVAESSGLAVEFRSQKRRQLTDQQREAKRLAMAAINAKKRGELSTITRGFASQISTVAVTPDSWEGTHAL
jgi:hypothetical protein